MHERSSLVILLILLLAIATTRAASIFDQSKGKCLPIEIELCKDSPYNSTFYHNSLLNSDQTTLAAQTEHFKPLIKTKCHEHIKFFVCSVFAPMCPEAMPQAVTSCRSVCLQVKKDCESILTEFGIEWPEPLHCERFPEQPDLCMKPPGESRPAAPRQNPASKIRRITESLCPNDLVDVDPMDTERGICGFKCGAEVMFKRVQKEAARTWMFLWGGVDVFVSALCFFTFLIDRKRFRFPERCVFYISLCFMFFAIPHLFPFFLTFPEMACEQLPHLVKDDLYLVHGGMDNSHCLVSFGLTYYFGTAACLWWLMFGFTWYLSAGRKWVPEGIEACSSYVHLIAWGISALMTIAVLILQKVDASELTGICSVGNQDPEALLYFVLVPRTIFVVLGTCFVVAGFGSMCRERDSFRGRGTDTSKLDKLMLKMGFFCLLYTVPAIVQLVCEYYHYLIIKQWHPATIACKMLGGVEAGACKRPPMPQWEIFLFGLITSLAIGTSCVIWILSPKTFASWQRVLFCGLCSEAPSKSPFPNVVYQGATRPLLEPQPPSVAPPQPPTNNHYVPMTTHSHNTWRTSKVV